MATLPMPHSCPLSPPSPPAGSSQQANSVPLEHLRPSSPAEGSLLCCKRFLSCKLVPASSAEASMPRGDPPPVGTGPVRVGRGLPAGLSPMPTAVLAHQGHAPASLLQAPFPTSSLRLTGSSANTRPASKSSSALGTPLCGGPALAVTLSRLSSLLDLSSSPARWQRPAP